MRDTMRLRIKQVGEREVNCRVPVAPHEIAGKWPGLHQAGGDEGFAH